MTAGFLAANVPFLFRFQVKPSDPETPPPISPRCAGVTALHLVAQRRSRRRHPPVGAGTDHLVLDLRGDHLASAAHQFDDTVRRTEQSDHLRTRTRVADAGPQTHRTPALNAPHAQPKRATHRCRKGQAMRSRVDEVLSLTGKVSWPLEMNDWMDRSSSAGTASARLGKRANSAGSATSAYSRASGAPR